MPGLGGLDPRLPLVSPHLLSGSLGSAAPMGTGLGGLGGVAEQVGETWDGGPTGGGEARVGGKHVGAHSGLAFVAPNGLVAPASRGDSSSAGVQGRLQAKQLPVSS